MIVCSRLGNVERLLCCMWPVTVRAKVLSRHCSMSAVCQLFHVYVKKTLPHTMCACVHLEIKSNRGVGQIIALHAGAAWFGLAARPPTGPPLLNFLIHVSICAAPIYPACFCQTAFIPPPTPVPLCVKTQRPSQTDAERK